MGVLSEFKQRIPLDIGRRDDGIYLDIGTGIREFGAYKIREHRSGIPCQSPDIGASVFITKCQENER